ncbi:MAG TPA: DNA glycosylase [Parabacteroides sp.]|nr:DNA glycosylase [Parabacteroides sp.]
MNKNQLEVHPLGFFLPPNTKLLMLGSFPPPQQRWSMDFFYPNIQNDMWRILGYIFYSDKDYFLESPRKFSERKCKEFCSCIGLGIGDTGMEVIRQKGNASDKFLEIVTPIDLKRILEQIPLCKAIVVTGQKAMDTLLSVILEYTTVVEPAVGDSVSFQLFGKEMLLFRMPSTSRAYPKPLVEKAVAYRRMFESLGMIAKEGGSKKKMVN